MRFVRHSGPGQISRRRLFQLAGGMGLATAAWPLAAACGQRSSGQRVPHLGVLWLESPNTVGHTEAFSQGLRERDYIEGQSIHVHSRYAHGDASALPDLARELVAQGVDVLAAGSTPATRAAMDATKTIPIVMIAVADPVGNGLIQSIARPGGNVTGVTPNFPTFGGKQVEYLRECVPGARRAVVFWTSTLPVSAAIRESAVEAGQLLDLQLEFVDVRRASDISAALDAALRFEPDGLVVLGGPINLALRAQYIEFAASQRLPAVYPLRDFAEAGGLLSYGVSLPALVRRAGYYVDRILRGEPPATLPVEQPMEFDLVLNLNTARALDLTFPRSLLRSATALIQ